MKQNETTKPPHVGGSGLNVGLDDLPFKSAAKELMSIPRYYESEALTLAKVKLADGRDAIIRMELTTEEDAVEEADIWMPNAGVTGAEPQAERPR